MWHVEEISKAEPCVLDVYGCIWLFARDYHSLPFTFSNSKPCQCCCVLSLVPCLFSFLALPSARLQPEPGAQHGSCDRGRRTLGSVRFSQNFPHFQPHANSDPGILTREELQAFAVSAPLRTPSSGRPLPLEAPGSPWSAALPRGRPATRVHPETASTP